MNNAWTQNPSDWRVPRRYPDTKGWMDTLSPWLIVAGFIVFVCLLNGLIGG